MDNEPNESTIMWRPNFEFTVFQNLYDKALEKMKRKQNFSNSDFLQCPRSVDIEDHVYNLLTPVMTKNA